MRTCTTHMAAVHPCTYNVHYFSRHRAGQQLLPRQALDGFDQRHRHGQGDDACNAIIPHPFRVKKSAAPSPPSPPSASALPGRQPTGPLRFHEQQYRHAPHAIDFTTDLIVLMKDPANFSCTPRGFCSNARWWVLCSASGGVLVSHHTLFRHPSSTGPRTGVRLRMLTSTPRATTPQVRPIRGRGLYLACRAFVASQSTVAVRCLGQLG